MFRAAVEAKSLSAQADIPTRRLTRGEFVARGKLGVTRDGRPARVAKPGPGTLEYTFRSVRGGRRACMEMAALATEYDARMQEVVDSWHALTPWQQRQTRLDDLVAKSSLSPGEFLSFVVRAAFEHTRDVVVPLYVSYAFPDLLEAAKKRAMTPEGFEDRWLLLEAGGYFDDFRSHYRKPLEGIWARRAADRHEPQGAPSP